MQECIKPSIAVNMNKGRNVKYSLWSNGNILNVLSRAFYKNKNGLNFHGLGSTDKFLTTRPWLIDFLKRLLWSVAWLPALLPVSTASTLVRGVSMALISEQRGVYDVIIPSLGSSGKVAKKPTYQKHCLSQDRLKNSQSL